MGKEGETEGEGESCRHALLAPKSPVNMAADSNCQICFQNVFTFFFSCLGRNLIRYALDNELVTPAYRIFLTGKIDCVMACFLELVVCFILVKSSCRFFLFSPGFGG